MVIKTQNVNVGMMNKFTKNGERKVKVHLIDGFGWTWNSTFSCCGIQLDGLGMQGREIDCTDDIKKVTCKRCIASYNKNYKD